jgi:hypothetical protein
MANVSDEALNKLRKVELANQLFRQFYARCFWHMKPDLQITEPMIALIVKGLETHGGHEGFLAAARLLE